MRTNHKIWMLIGFIGIFASSCENELQINPISNIGADGFFQTESDIEQAVAASYDALQEEGQYGFDFMFLMEIRSDNAFVESPTNSGVDQGDIELFNISSGKFRIEDAWNSSYRGIQRFNTVLNRIGAIEMDATIKNTRIGEVKFLRALTYFNLVRLWGDVPLVVTETKDPFEAFSVGRSPVSEVYTQIITDLSEAIDVLPTSNEAGRATKGAAQTLLGKVHLTLSDWDEAVSTLDGIIGYTLQANFEDNFGIANENGVESIFEVQFQGGSGSVINNSLTNNTGEGSPYPNQVSPVGSADELLNGIGSQRGENIPTDMLFDSFETGDLRRGASIGVLSNGTTKYAKKLVDIPVDDNDSGLNFIVLRYADVLLMKAEALNEQGYVANGEAFDLMNRIRNRAGLADLTAVDLPGQESFRNAIAEERRHEFVSENQRWFDLLRTGKAIEVMNASTSAFSVSDFQLIYPIPLSAIDAINNPIIFPQNPEY